MAPTFPPLCHLQRFLLKFDLEVELLVKSLPLTAAIIILQDVFGALFISTSSTKQRPCSKLRTKATDCSFNYTNLYLKGEAVLQAGVIYNYFLVFCMLLYAETKQTCGFNRT